MAWVGVEVLPVSVLAAILDFCLCEWKSKMAAGTGNSSTPACDTKKVHLTTYTAAYKQISLLHQIVYYVERRILPVELLSWNTWLTSI